MRGNDGERGRCDIPKGNKDGGWVGVGQTIAGITCFIFLSSKVATMSLV